MWLLYCRVNTLFDVTAGNLYISAEVLDRNKRSTVALTVARDARGAAKSVLSPRALPYLVKKDIAQLASWLIAVHEYF